MLLRILQRDVTIRILNILADLKNLEKFNLIEFRVVIGLDLTLLTKNAFCGRGQRDFQGFDQYGLIHAFFVANLPNDFAEFQIHE